LLLVIPLIPGVLMRIRKYCSPPEILEAERIENAGFLAVDAEGLSSNWPSPEEVLHIQEAERKIDQILKTLSPREEKVLRMWMNEKSRGEIAQSLGTNENQVRQISVRALRKLRQPDNARILRRYLHQIS
jgi:RNA polymerase sigma factor (sigma-70 family)